jgi:hypothetical protein
MEGNMTRNGEQEDIRKKTVSTEFTVLQVWERLRESRR